MNLSGFIKITEMKNKKIKAVALFSGGLDSILAIKLLLEQGVEVVAVYFELPFCTPVENGDNIVKDIAQKLGINLRIVQLGKDYIEMVKQPKFGHGSGMNPCIDCKIFMLNLARSIAGEEGAEVVVTGEVLNQRPMSQYRIALQKIEKESGLKGRLLRPLSAKFLPETNVEKEGLIDRNKLLSIHGRGRKEQLSLAKQMDVENFIPAAGGCALTDKFFVKKLQDILKYNKDAGLDDIMILAVRTSFQVWG